MARQDIAGQLAGIRLFRGADAAFFDRIAQQPRARLRINAGDPIYAAGDVADALYAAIPAETGAIAPRSVVELTLPTSDTGPQSHVEHIAPGDVFGEFEFVAAGLSGARLTRRSSARALAEAELYRIPFALLTPLLAGDDAIRSRLIKLSFDRLIEALNVKSTHLTGDRDAAFANWLLDAAENLGIAEGRHVRFSRTISQKEIAEALGVTRETMSLRLNEWERAGLLNTGGQSQRLEILDYPRVALRAAIHREPPQATIDEAIAEIDADISRGDLVRARNIALDMLTAFPASPDMRHRLALASIRAGNDREALAGLAQGGFATAGDIALLRDRVRLGIRRPDVAPERLFFGNEDGSVDGDAFDDTARDIDGRTRVLTEDIAAIQARAEKELAFAESDPAQRQRHAAASASTYANIHEAIGGYYAGINAAMMATIAGDLARAKESTAKVIRQVSRLADGYWPHATLAEAHLLNGSVADAIAALADAHRQADATDGHRYSTRLQIGRIGAHLGIDIADLLAVIPVGATAVFSGPLFRGASQDDATQDALEQQVRGAVDAAIAAEGIRYIYGALACGADIIVAEAALDAGAELHVVLPFPADAFFETSVALGNPPEAPNRWTDRYWNCLRQSASLTALIERPPDTKALDFHFFHAFKLAAGLALLRADALTSRSVMLSIDDKRKEQTVAGAARATNEWATLDQSVVTIPIAIDRSREAKPALGGPKQADTFRAVIFLWPVDEPANLKGIVAAAAKASGVKLAGLERSSRDRRSGLALPVDTIADAIAALSALADQCAGLKHPVRILADFGPATDARGRPNEGAISRLSGASDIVGLPPSVAIVTRTLAARARAEGIGGVRYVPISRTAEVDDRALASREVYRLDFVAGT